MMRMCTICRSIGRFFRSIIIKLFRVNTDFYAEYTEAIEAYLDGEWEYALEAIEK